MAAIVIEAGAQFDAVAFYAQAEKLPVYARPLFVRIVPAMDVTGTLKQRKLDLQRQGYDVSTITDPVYFRDDSRRVYVPLTSALLEPIRSGAVRL
jgi:fatty-acyl-CoA synthase